MESKEDQVQRRRVLHDVLPFLDVQHSNGLWRHLSSGVGFNHECLQNNSIVPTRHRTRRERDGLPTRIRCPFYFSSLSEYSLKNLPTVLTTLPTPPCTFTSPLPALTSYGMYISCHPFRSRPLSSFSDFSYFKLIKVRR